MGKELYGKEDKPGLSLQHTLPDVTYMLGSCRNVAVEFGPGEIFYYAKQLVLRNGDAGVDFSTLRSSKNPKDPKVYHGKFFELIANHICKVCMLCMLCMLLCMLCN